MKKDIRKKAVVAIFLILLVVSYKLYFTKDHNVVDQGNETQMIFESKDLIDTKNLTLLEKYRIDVDGDNEDEEVQLYTAAERDADGEIMWDDGQNWLMLVKDSDRAFVLFDGYIQLGELKLWIYTTDEDNKMHITTLQPSSASALVDDYIFVEEKQGFEKKILFNPKNVNMLHMSK
ncbi:hypothetical protein [Marinisporobacter balticus]|uniref:Uncharacterized protein n=1 Tax=Marinisporobacter balticus TaxID=2018667 RepID=A0A4R2K865_9FIRM|nr:hypothetical protein [Marinisporobacter balticus]TCO68252.1 hypothetical protein EV214_1474 [Marinisporobacter balticus]